MATVTPSAALVIAVPQDVSRVMSFLDHQAYLRHQRIMVETSNDKKMILDGAAAGSKRRPKGAIEMAP